MSDAGSTQSPKGSVKDDVEEEASSDEDMVDSEDEDETIARIQRAHYAQVAAMNARRRAAPRSRPLSAKRKMEAVKNFQDFTKKLKKDTGINIKGLVGNNILDFNDFSSDGSTESDGLSETEFEVNPSAVQELNELHEENESYIDPETGDIVEAKKELHKNKCPTPPPVVPEPESEGKDEPKTLSISDIISDVNDGELDLSKTVECAEVEEGELCSEKTAEELLDIKQEGEETSQDYDITEKLKEMGEISVKPVKEEGESEEPKKDDETNPENDDEKKPNPNALNVRRNIREVMDEKNLDASTLAAQRQESERLARVQEQQRIIREVQRQIALNRQNKIHQKTLSLLSGGSSILKQSSSSSKLNLPNTVLVKLPSGETKKTIMKQGQLEVTKVPKPTTSAAGQKPDQKTEKKEVVEIVDSSSGDESSSSSSDSDDCIMLSDSEVPPSPEAEEDPNNSGLHVNDAYNIPDEQGRVLINIGHPETEEDIFLAPQIARVIKPHQIGGVRFLFDNIIESVERFSTSTGFGCILAHSMGLGKTLQIVCFTDIFLRHTTSKTVLCIMPINTLQNWVAEFNMWLPVDASASPLAAHGEVRTRNFPIYVLNDSHKTLQMRAKVVKEWKSSGGVLMIGYELYRLLSMKKDKKPRKKRKGKDDPEKDKDKDKDDKKDKPDVNEDTQGSDITMQSKMSEESKDVEGDAAKADGDDKKDDKKEDTPNDEEKKLLDEMYEALVKPGPDLVICDEGHRIKNSHSNISYALKQMRTKRRVVLTGYPLQNNLLEYWCMVDFVRPNYLGSKTEFCNMFERPIQNGQCIDSTPQDIRLMRYRAHVLHSLLVGFVQRRSHAVLQSTLPQKEEYVLLVRMTPLQRKLYDHFMNEVVRCTSVPNPLKAFAICCKIWNHPDVLYNFLKKRSEVNAAIEEDLDLEELRGVTKAGRSRNNRPPAKRGPKPRGGAGKKPAATIPPNTTGSAQRPEPYGNAPYPPNGPYGPNPYPRPDQGPYPYNYPAQQPGYYPPNQGYNQNYDQNYYQQQQPYNSNYPNQYPQNNPEWNQGYNQNNWGNNSGYYGNNSGYYNNPQYPNGQPPQEYNQQQYPPNYTAPTGDQTYPTNAIQPYTGNQEGYPNQQRPYPAPYQQQPGYTNYNNAGPSGTPESSYPNNQPPPQYPNNQPPTYPNNQPPPYPNNQPAEYPNQPQTFPPPYADNTTFGPNQPPPFNQYENQPQNYPGYNNVPPNQPPNAMPNQEAIKAEPGVPPVYPTNDVKPNVPPQENAAPYGAPGYNYNQPNTSAYPEQGANGNYPCQYPFPPHLETKPPLDSAGSNSPVTSWPITELKTEVSKLKLEEKTEIKSESDGEVKIEDLDTKKLVKDESKKDLKGETPALTDNKTESDKKEASSKKDNGKAEAGKSDGSESEEELPKRRGRKPNKKDDKAKGKSKAKPRGRKDRKTSKDKNKDDKENSDSEESEKEEKLSREEELALSKKAEEMTYDWAAELLKDYVPGIIENSAKMELFFYILNESIKMGDRLLLFSQSLFTLNLIEDFLERNYIPGKNCVWERNVNYYRLDGSTHALEREKLINEFNANPNIYLFLVSTRAGSLGINLVGANRVIVFDASWNPCHDTQAVCRVYRYGQKKPCFVYRFVMDWCLEKKIYDRQINKQGMADRVVDECNPDAVLSMKEITNLCFDNDEKETEPKDLTEHLDRYLDVLMQGILTHYGKKLSKEPFQHESLLVDRKEKKLSSAEKRLAQRGYELEKKAALAPKPTTAYRTVRAADGSLVQRPVASVRPMQHGARWIPADVWRRQGMTAQEMTLPLDVVIPTNSAEKTNIVLKAGQRVMVLKSPKGIYMQLESGKIIAIKTSFKGLAGQKGDGKDSAVGKKVLGGRPSAAIPGSLKNNSAITITSKSAPNRPGFHRIMNRPNIPGQKLGRPLMPGQKIAEIRNRLGEMRSYTGVRPKFQGHPGKMLRPHLPGSVSITKISRDPKRNDNKKMDVDSEPETQVLDSDDDDGKDTDKSSDNKSEDKKPDDKSEDPQSSNSSDKTEENKQPSKPMVLTTDEKLPSEETLDNKSTAKPESTKTTKNTSKQNPPRFRQNETVRTKPQMPPSQPHEMPKTLQQDIPTTPQEEVQKSQLEDVIKMQQIDAEKEGSEKKINPLKNYRHQRPVGRAAAESSLSILERTASVLNKEGMPDFRRNLDDITQSYSPGPDEKPATKSKKKKSPNKDTESQNDKQSSSGMSHSISSMLGNSKEKIATTAPVAPLGQSPRISPGVSPGLPHDIRAMPHPMKPMGHMMGPGSPDMAKHPPNVPAIPMNPGPLPGQAYPAAHPPQAPEGHYGQYPPGYGMGYGGYPNAPPYYGGYGGAAPYYPGVPGYGAAGAPPAPYAPPAPAPAPPPEGYLPPNPQW
ncbi:hypothetical protein O0L34_g16255 [Tuta absoluta]|nr:hypothetical protein O0L34_g16255 [Tuta absoluta]